MKKPNFKDSFKRVCLSLQQRVYSAYRKLDRGTDEAFSEEPIDFSSPSVPYYENIASRLHFARIALYMALFVFVLVTVVSNHRLITYENLYYLARDIGASTLTAQSEAERLSYPVSSSEANFGLFRGGMVVAGSEVVTVMSGSGRQTLSINVDYADPEVRTSDKYFLTFDRGECSYAVYNTFVQVHKGITEYPVYDAAAADDGTHAILTRSRDYTSEVLVYDSNMECLLALRRVGYVTGMALAPDGSSLGVVSIEEENGLFTTKITLVRLNDRITEESVTIEGSVGNMCGYTTVDRFAVLFSDRLLVFKPDASITAEDIWDGRTPVIGSISGGKIAVLFRSDSDLSDQSVKTYDHNGRQLADVILTADHPIQAAGGAVELARGGNTLYVRTRNHLLWLDGDDLSLVKSVSISHDTLDILPLDGDSVMVCTPAYADRLSD